MKGHSLWQFRTHRSYDLRVRDTPCIFNCNPESILRALIKLIAKCYIPCWLHSYVVRCWPRDHLIVLTSQVKSDVCHLTFIYVITPIEQHSAAVGFKRRCCRWQILIRRKTSKKKPSKQSSPTKFKPIRFNHGVCVSVTMDCTWAFELALFDDDKWMHRL